MSTKVKAQAKEIEDAFQRELVQYRAKWAGAPKTKRTEELAVLAARVLADEGLAKFSMRLVAERAGMSLASLQYHFNSLDALLKAMIDYRIDSYVDQALAYLDGLAGDPQKAFRIHVSAFIDDAVSEHTARFTAQYQALACIDAYAEEALDHYMRIYRESLGLFIRRMNPSLGADEATRRGALLAGMIDGLMIVASSAKPEHAALKTIKKDVEHFALAIALAPPISSR